MRRVAVLGGGVSGLTAALALLEGGFDVMLFEREARAGGCIQTLHEDGFTIELGPDSLLASKPAAAQILKTLDLDRDVVSTPAQTSGAFIVHHGALRPLPGEFRLFMPSSIPALLRSGIFSVPGMLRAALEPFVPRRASAGDESIASFVTRRFGREVLDRLAQPLLGGIYSGDPARLSMRATLPEFLELERRHGSLLRAMAAEPKRTPPRLVSLRAGLGAIVDAMMKRIGGRLRTSAEVVGIEPAREGWRLVMRDGSNAEVTGIVCALPAYAAARLLRAIDPPLADRLERIRYNSIATVNLAYDTAQLPPLPSVTGFVVPQIEGRDITAATFSTFKYPDRSPADAVLLRAFLGGAFAPALVERSDEELAQTARAEFASLLGITATPRFAVTRRWLRLLPEYTVGHADYVREIVERTRAHDGLALAGSAYTGVGIPDCMQSGLDAAQRVMGARQTG
jgi:oxygen-dependent protoporphyrinogen oxidase